MIDLGAALRRHWPRLVLGAVFVAVAVVHLAWHVHAQRVPTFDQAHHLTVGIDCARALQSGRFLSQCWLKPEAYPPGYHLLLAVGTILFGAGPAVGLLVNLAALAVALLAIHRLGTRLAHHRVGLLAAILFALYPGTALLVREALQELVLATVTVVSVNLLLDYRERPDRKAALRLGLALGFGLLVKPSFAFALWLPLGCVAVLMLRRPERSALLNAALVGVVALGLAALWYVPHRADLRALMELNRADALRWGHPAAAWAGFRQLQAILTVGDLTRFGAAVALATFALSAALALRRLWLLHAWIVGTWLVVVLALVFRDDKYLLPTLPAVALLTAEVFDRLQPAWLRRASVAVLGAAHLVAFAHAEVGWPRLPEGHLLAIENPYAGMGGREPSLPAIVTALGGRAPATGVRVGVVPNTRTLNCNTLAWQARRTDAALTFEHLSYSGYYSVPGALRRAAQLDVTLLKTGEQGFAPTVDTAAALTAGVRGAPETFRLVETFPLADGSQAEVYRVDAPAVRLATEAETDALLSRSDPAYRDLTFGGRFRVLALTLDPEPPRTVLRIAWTALEAGPLDLTVGVHLLDERGVTRGGHDHPQAVRAAQVPAGARWIDELPLSPERLAGARSIGLCLYRTPDERLAIDRGPRDSGGTRLLVPMARPAGPRP